MKYSTHNAKTKRALPVGSGRRFNPIKQPNEQQHLFEFGLIEKKKEEGNPAPTELIGAFKHTLEASNKLD